MRRDIAREFELDPALTHLNHGAFGAVPRTVRLAQDRARAAVEGAPMRAFRDELPTAVAKAREAAAAFVGVPGDAAALVRNVSEGVAVVLECLGIGPDDEVVVTDHGYPTAAFAVQARGARVRTVPVALDASPADLTTALATAVTDRTRLVVVDQITSPTALVLPVADVAAAVAPVPVLVDAAHVPGALPGLEVEALGADFWVGNLHKWAYAPRSAAVLWVAAPHRGRVRPLVTSWSDGEPFPARFDLQGTVDHSAWLAVPDGIAFWHDLGGWEQVRRNAALLRAGAGHLRDVLGTVSPRDGIPSAPCLEVVALPPGVADTPEAAEALWQRLYAAGFVVPPVSFGGRGLLRLAAAPYNDADDYERLADALADLLPRA